MINTKHVRDRRKLRFENVEAAISDAIQLAASERSGGLRATGNWTLGQALGHVAFWASAPYDGYPDMRRPPWLMRLLMPLMKRHILNKGMPAGIRVPGTPTGTFGTDVMETDQGLVALQNSLTRLAAQAPADDNPVFGSMTHEDWLKLNLRHAELHLSFFHPS
jgi:hypothetical protein